MKLSERVISNIKAGWCDFDLEGFHGKASYVRAVPMDILQGILNYLEEGGCVISFDEEGSEFHLILIADEPETYIISVRDKAELYTVKKNPNVVTALLYDDIVTRMNEWIDWLSDDARDHEHYANRMKRLLGEIDDRRRKNSKK